MRDAILRFDRSNTKFTSAAIFGHESKDEVVAMEVDSIKGKGKRKGKDFHGKGKQDGKGKGYGAFGLGKVRVIRRVIKERLTVRDIVMEKEKETKDRVTKERAKTKVSARKETTIGTVGITHLGTKRQLVSESELPDWQSNVRQVEEQTQQGTDPNRPANQVSSRASTLTQKQGRRLITQLHQ